MCQACPYFNYGIIRECRRCCRNGVGHSQQTSETKCKAVLAKTAERLIGRDLVSLSQKTTYGEKQWAFTPGLSARDMVTAIVMLWILAFCKGKKVAAYLGDISGAFDRVFTEYNLAKLHAAGVG